MLIFLWLLLGLILGTAYILFARARGERRVFAYGLIVAALAYVAFALVGTSTGQWIAIEVFGVLVYGLFAVLGLSRSQLWLALGWAAHPIWDVWLHLIGGGSAFSPAWYSYVCITFDLLVATYIVIQSRRRSGPNNSFKPTPHRGVGHAPTLR
jgi:hypothetical protein